MKEHFENTNQSPLFKRIGKIINFIDEAKKKHTKSDTLIEYLDIVRNILSDSQVEGNKINIAKLHEAIHFIETISVEKKSFFWEKDAATLADIFVTRKEAILPESERAQPTPVTVTGKLPRKYHEIFGPIHCTLYDLAIENKILKQNSITPNSQEKSKPAWKERYRGEGEITNQVVGNWQASRMKLGESTEKASKDYLRNVGVRGMHARIEEDIKPLLQYLVNCTNYQEDDKDILQQWLEHNGHQSNKDFINLLAHAGAIISEKEVVLGGAKTDELNWTVENGEIVMNIDISINSLIMNNKIYINNKHMKLVETDSPPKTTESPLLRFQSQVKLHINEDHVVEPQISQMIVTSYTNDLQPSDELLQQNSPVSRINQ
ncbi:hypothetical protein [Legionella fallonii]|uniref:Uncharacterized protein n=1 Tax=Legionella fallonii LLAP-10 TaxID=1212491 RepID=A0A098G5I2_9GAMM|nr:hypothetical protein [Legionella fallonii]CEG57239.1 protein of unknown function [Legionella fallonii LLAP-10]